MKKALLLFSLLLSSAVYADQTVVSQFLGINNNESSAIISDSSAQDLLNVDITPNGKSVKKRLGYGIYKALGSGQSIHGAYHFYSTAGSDIQLWGSSTSLYGITSDAAPVQIISSATLNSTWQCADTQGSAYCVDSGRDLLLKTDGATIQQWMTSPLGTMVAITPDRLIVAGVSGSRNTLFISQANVFNNFTVGINQTDPFTEVIAAPGAAITHIRYGCQKLLWWKNSSFGYLTGSNQFDLGVVTVNDSIGTSDNSSALDPGGTVWFRGQDGNIYSYDCSVLRKESIDITPLVQASANRTANSWTQTSQSDFQSGISTQPTNGLSFTISPGDIVPTSFTKTNNSASDWNTGTKSNVVVVVNSLRLDTNNTNVANNSFDSALGPEWLNSGFIRRASGGGDHCTVVPIDGSNFVDSQSGSYGGSTLKAEIIDSNTSAVLASTLINGVLACGWNVGRLDSTGFLRRRVRLKFTNNTDTLQTSPMLLGGDITYDYQVDSKSSGQQYVALDNVLNGSDTITTGNFTSASYDTAVSSCIFQITALNYTPNTSTPTIVLQTSADNITFSDLLTSTGTNASGNRYVRFISTITAISTGDANTTLDGVTLIARSTGSYYSSIHNAPNLSAWDVFTVDRANNGGSQTFYIRSASSSFTSASSTPTWVAQTAGSLVSASTGTYFQVRDDFGMSSASSTPTLNDFTVNWFEGNASDKAYSLFFDNSIWWSVAYGAGQSSNNYIFKYDLINKTWLLYNFGAGGMLQQGSYLYFGSTATANTFKFGAGTSDNGATITSFWRSKDFAGADPWLENQYNQLDSYYKTNANQTVGVSYYLNTSTTSTTYTVNLSSTTQSVIRNKKLLPNGKIGGNINIQFGDVSDSSAWELLGFRFTFNPLPYKPTQ